MAPQIPGDAAGAVAMVLIYSFISLACGLFLIWMVWVHGERQSYVLMLAGFVSLHTIASIMQQSHTIALWRDIKTAQWENVKANVGNPELNITGASTGFDLVLFYIQYYCYNVESMLVAFWAIELANSIFHIRFIKAYRIHASIYAKIAATLLPAAQQVLLRFSAVQNNTTVFMGLADAIMIVCFGLGSLIMFAILAKYVHSRFSVASWNVRYGQASGGGTGNSIPKPLRNPNAPQLTSRQNIYDKWLVLRFSIAFVSLGLFQLVVVNFQLRAASTNNADNIPEYADLSGDRAKGDFTLFVPGASAPLLIFFVFGTTRTFRDYMWRTFMPKSLQEKRAARKRRNTAPTGQQSGPSGGSAVRQQRGDDLEQGYGDAMRMKELPALPQRTVGQGRKSQDDEWPILNTPTSPTGGRGNAAGHGTVFRI